MNDTSNYIFLPSFSIQPNKVTSYNSVFIANKVDGTIKSIHDFKKRFNNNLGFNELGVKVNKPAHNLTISTNAYNNLKKKINWLYYLSKAKSVSTKNGKDIYNFKIGFVTLTLSSKQKHPTKYITENMLNQFLTEIRLKYNMINYVWRLEFQKNGNVHYHLVTDTFLPYDDIRTVWNRIQYKNGYIQEYQKKFSKLSLTEYNKVVNNDNKVEFKKIAIQYAKAKACNWSQPPSVNLKSVMSNKAISNYISKYFAKDNHDNPIKNELDTPDNSENLRLWFCSRSLSKLKSISNFCEAVKYDIFSIVSFAEKVNKVIHKYAVSFYFEISSMKGNARKWIEMLLKDYSIKQGYIPAS